ncbi:MAG: hypothetical protein ACLP1Q_17325 [Solirubrobacteraceae bacterium]
MSAHGGNGVRPSTPASAQSAAASGGGSSAGTDSGAGGIVLPAGGLPTPSGSMSELRRRRLELAERVAALTWDLGGLAYEMAIRDHYRLDVLARKASELQEVDAQLGEVQRLLATAEAGVHGQCRSCGAVHSRGAAYCWHCGAPLMQEARPSVLPSNQPA